MLPPAALLAVAAGCADDAQLASERLLHRLLVGDLSGYDVSVTPAPRPVTAWVGGTITKLVEFSTEEQTFKVSMELVHSWTDSRLQWDPGAHCNTTARYGLKPSQVWRPDSFFENAQKVDTVGHDESVSLYSNGSVIWKFRAVVTFFCAMSFASYPFDVQHCESAIESYGLPVDTLRYELAPDHAAGRSADGAAHCPGGVFALCDTAQAGTYVVEPPVAVSEVAEVGGVRYSRVTVHFAFSRVGLRYFLTFFLPLVMVTSLSYLALFVDAEQAPARVLMAINTVLVLVSLVFVLTKDIPSNITYLSSVDTLFILCFAFVWANCLEYAVVSWLLTQLRASERDAGCRRRLQRSGGEPDLSSDALAALRAELQEIFGLFDRGTGHISMPQFCAIIVSLAADRDTEIHPERARALAAEADADGNGALDFEEFCTFIQLNPALRSELGLCEAGAVAVCGVGVSRRTVRRIESRYRRGIAPAFAGVWCLWFVITVVGVDTGRGVAAVFFTAVSAVAAVAANVRWGHRMSAQPVHNPAHCNAARSVPASRRASALTQPLLQHEAPAPAAPPAHLRPRVRR